jgi:hypothetical protein
MVMHTESFNGNDLMLVYTTPSLATAYPGNKVMLKSGSPKMTVCYVKEDKTTAVVQWLDDNKQIITDEFPLIVLTCWGAE